MYGKNEYDDILVSGGGEPLRELALFAGVGGGILGGKLLGWRTVCAVEIEPFCRQVLRARQDDGSLERFPIFDDVRAFDGRAWRGRVDVISGGFPCQDISCAGRGGGDRRAAKRTVARVRAHHSRGSTAVRARGKFADAPGKRIVQSPR